jgi:dephospho-CoA kinase
VFAVPLLVETAGSDRYGRVLLVDCMESTQIERVQARSGLAEAAVRAIIVQQASRSERLRAAHDVIVNDSSVEALQSRCARLHAVYRDLAATRRAAESL